MSIELIVIKAVGNRCNLNCCYCYAVPVEKHTLMSEEILEQTIKSIAVQNTLPIYFWGGGEPLLAGIEFFEKAIKLQLKHCGGRRFINSLQTNGILLDAIWLDFFKENNFQIGISWDGHMGLSRVGPNGMPFVDKIWSKIKLCLKRNLNFGIITVITRQNIKYLSQIAESLYLNGIKNLLFKPYIGKVVDLSINPAAYASAMCKILDLWMETKDNNWIIEPIHSFVKTLSGDFSNIACNIINNCEKFLTIEYNGDITCCDFVSQRLVFGNVCETNIKEVVDKTSYRKFSDKIKIKSLVCNNCMWNCICGGGCLHYRDFDISFQTWGEYSLCEARKEIFNYYRQRLLENKK